MKSIEEELEEEIEEDLSVAEDLLRSDNSGVCTIINSLFLKKSDRVVIIVVPTICVQFRPGGVRVCHG